MQTETIQTGKTLETWTPDEVREGLAKKDIVLIDVRTPAEYMFEHIEGTLLAPLSYLPTASLPAGLGKSVVLYCGSGIRSKKAAELCLNAGYDRIAHLDGGFANWKATGQTYLGTNMGTGAPERMAKTPALAA